MLDDKDARLREVLRRVITAGKLRRVELEDKVRYFDVRPRLERDRNRLQRQSGAALRFMELALAGKRRRLENGAAKLEQLSPLRVLDRGYAIVARKSGAILKGPEGVEAGTESNPHFNCRECLPFAEA